MNDGNGTRPEWHDYARTKSMSENKSVPFFLGGVPTIFWGSYEPGAGCLLPPERPHRLDPEG
jgi:hypothetical protein